jgi:hypothetical protein
VPDPSSEVLAQIPAIRAKRLEVRPRVGLGRRGLWKEELRRDEAEAEGALAAAETSITAAVRGVVQAAQSALCAQACPIALARHASVEGVQPSRLDRSEFGDDPRLRGRGGRR